MGGGHVGGGMPERGGASIRIGVFVGVLFCGCGKLFAIEKNSKKRGVSVSVLVVDVDKPRMRCVRSNVCATGSCPHCLLFRVGSR